MTHRRPGRVVGAALAIGVLAAAVGAPSATAAPNRGATTIELGGRVGKALRALDVRLAGSGAVRASARRIALPVAGGTVARRATLRHRGAVTFRVRRQGGVRRVRLAALRTTVTPRRATVTARVGKRRVPVFTVTAPARRVTLDATAGTARLTRGTVRLTPRGAATLRRGLRLRGLAAGPVGGGRIAARLPQRGGAPQCEGYDVDPVPEASAPLARPATATPITSATVWWRPKESWIRYINSGLDAGDGASTRPPAVAGAPEVGTEVDPTSGFPVSSGRFVYRFSFPLDPAQSWHDAASGTTALRLSGGVHFGYRARGIDITMVDPEIELTGARSRLVFRFLGSDCTDYGDRRVEFATLDGSALRRDGTRYTGTLPATITGPGNTAFTGAYFPGDAWGTVDVSFTTAAP